MTKFRKYSPVNTNNYCESFHGQIRKGMRRTSFWHGRLDHMILNSERMWIEICAMNTKPKNRSKTYIYCKNGDGTTSACTFRLVVTFSSLHFKVTGRFQHNHNIQRLSQQQIFKRMFGVVWSRKLLKMVGAMTTFSLNCDNTICV